MQKSPPERPLASFLALEGAENPGSQNIFFGNCILRIRL